MYQIVSMYGNVWGVHVRQAFTLFDLRRLRLLYFQGQQLDMDGRYKPNDLPMTFIDFQCDPPSVQISTDLYWQRVWDLYLF